MSDKKKIERKGYLGNVYENIFIKNYIFGYIGFTRSWNTNIYLKNKYEKIC